MIRVRQKRERPHKNYSYPPINPYVPSLEEEKEQEEKMRIKKEKKKRNVGFNLDPIEDTDSLSD